MNPNRTTRRRTSHIPVDWIHTSYPAWRASSLCSAPPASDASRCCRSHTSAQPYLRLVAVRHTHLYVCIVYIRECILCQNMFHTHTHMYYEPYIIHSMLVNGLPPQRDGQSTTGIGAEIRNHVVAPAPLNGRMSTA